MDAIRTQAQCWRAAASQRQRRRYKPNPTYSRPGLGWSLAFCIKESEERGRGGLEDSSVTRTVSFWSSRLICFLISSNISSFLMLRTTQQMSQSFPNNAQLCTVRGGGRQATGTRWKLKSMESCKKKHQLSIFTIKGIVSIEKWAVFFIWGVTLGLKI